MVLLFILVAPLVLLYSQGYVVNFKQPGLSETGGVFVKTVQPGAKVFVDSDFYRETSFISHGALITELAPKRYTVRVEKEGFQPWQKVVRVANAEVLEFRDIFLPPATITPRAVFRVRKDLPVRVTQLEGRAELALAVGNNTKPFTVFVVNTETHLARNQLIGVSRWVWDARSQTFFFSRSSDGRVLWYRLPFTTDGSGREERLTFRGLPAGFSAELVTPHPANPGEFYFFAGGSLFLQGRASVPIPIAEQIHSYAVTSDRLYFVSKSGFFVASDLDGGNAVMLGRKGLFLKEDEPARIFTSPAGDAVVLDSAGGLFVYQPGRDQELTLIAGNVLGVDFDGRGERMLFWDEHRLWVYWLQDNRYQPFDLARTKKQIFYSYDEPIQQAFLDAGGTHAFFSTPSGIKMTDVDDRGGNVVYGLVQGPLDSFALDKTKLTLSWVRDGALLQAELMQ